MKKERGHKYETKQNEKQRKNKGTQRKRNKRYHPSKVTKNTKRERKQMFENYV